MKWNFVTHGCCRSGFHSIHRNRVTWPMFQEVSSASTIKSPNWSHTPVDPPPISPKTTFATPPDAYVPDTRSLLGSRTRSICWYNATCSARNYRCREQSHCSIPSSCFLPNREPKRFASPTGFVRSFVRSSFRKKGYGGTKLKKNLYRFYNLYRFLGIFVKENLSFSTKCFNIFNIK